jgi:hypothetical protein
MDDITVVPGRAVRVGAWVVRGVVGAACVCVGACVGVTTVGWSVTDGCATVGGVDGMTEEIGGAACVGVGVTTGTTGGAVDATGGLVVAMIWRATILGAAIATDLCRGYRTKREQVMTRSIKQ